MPILRIPDAGDALSQGDILSGLRIYKTANNWTDAEEPGGSAEWLRLHTLALVVSRPCVILHKAHFIVFAIGVIKETVPEDVKTFEEVRAFLEQLRDGYRRLDRFYLGQIQGQPTGRYYSHLDSLHTVTQPPSEQLSAFLRAKRIATLSDEFRRDLHLRFFSAFASLGFDDHGWYSEEDLNWLIETGNSQLHKMKAELGEKKTELASLTASGTAKNQKQIESMQNNIKNLEAQVTKFEGTLKGIDTARTQTGNR